MATSTSVPVLLLLAAAALLLLPSSLAWMSNCPPTAPGCGGHGLPSYPAPGSGSPSWPFPGSGSGGCHCHPPPHHAPPSNCPPCNQPYVPPKPRPFPPYVPPYVPRTCPIDTLKLNACVDVLGLIHLVIGQEARAMCCPLLQGIADLDAALCLCTTIRLRLLNINIFLPVALNLLITCGKQPPSGFQCPPLYDTTERAREITGRLPPIDDVYRAPWALRSFLLP